MAVFRSVWCIVWGQIVVFIDRVVATVRSWRSCYNITCTRVIARRCTVKKNIDS